METKTLSLIAEKCPIVHCITNYVTINDCANIILAVGASPIMADDIAEVEDIVSIAGALVINIGSLNELTIPAMVRAGRRANALRRPVILDPVGVGASALRNETITKLLQEIRFSVIRGNISEIHAVAHGSGGAHGVDADAADALNSTNISGVIESAKALSNRTGAVIAISGATDIIVDSTHAAIIKNGHPMLARITGSGCMLTALIGAFIGANPHDIFSATAEAVCAMGICGERASDAPGSASFRTKLIDEMSTLTEETLSGGMKIEII